MSDVSEWLEANTEALAKIAASTELDVRLVQMVATFVLADLDDEQIDAQLFGHGFPLNSDPKRRAHLFMAIEEIRRLATMSGALESS